MCYFFVLCLEVCCKYSVDITLHYIKFTVKNAEAFQSLCRHFKIYSHYKLCKGRQEQMRFQFSFEGLQGI